MTTAEASSSLRTLEPELANVPGTVSVWCGRPGAQPAFTRNPDTTHYAASTMKTAVMVAAYRLADGGQLDLDSEITVHDDFGSATGAGTYQSTASYDSDPEPWRRLGSTVSLRWLVRRMIVRSSNLATNLVLEQVGLPGVADVWALAGAKHSVVNRGIEDYAAEQEGLSNLVTAADLAALHSALATGAAASPAACREMLNVLLAQEITVDVVQGLPPGTKVAHKNGWVDNIRHSAALIMPDDAPPYVLVTCISAPLDKESGCDLVAEVAAASWADRALF